MPLVQRSSRFRGFTPEGARLLEWSQRICADVRTMREEISAMKRGRLTGRLTIAVVPTALTMVSKLTDPFLSPASGRSRDHLFAHLERSAHDVAEFRDRRGADLCGQRAAGPGARRAALSRALPAAHVGEEPLRPAAKRDLERAWRRPPVPADGRHAEPAHHRRAVQASVGVQAAPALESNSIIVLVDHARTGRWATILPEQIASAMETPGEVTSIPIVEPEVAAHHRARDLGAQSGLAAGRRHRSGGQAPSGEVMNLAKERPKNK